MGADINFKEVLDFYKGKRVLITGNTGFKGSWLTYLLISAEAEVVGYSKEPPTSPSLFELIGLEESIRLKQYYADVRDLDALKKVFRETVPEIVVHMAAQPIVRDGYTDPVGTYSTNVMGTVNLCECVRLSHVNTINGGLSPDDSAGVKSFLNVTTDKVYKNRELGCCFREDDPLDGADPYSNSKSCSELVTHSFNTSYFSHAGVAVSTARAGNVIGGGDFSKDRIIPDCIRAITEAEKNKKRRGRIGVRNPNSTRPFQHVLEPLLMYLTILMKQYNDMFYAGYYNIGPDYENCVTTERLVDLFCDKWNSINEGLPELGWMNCAEPDAPYEAGMLKINCDLVKERFSWNPIWDIDRAIQETVDWIKIWMDSYNYNDKEQIRRIRMEMDREIELFIMDSC